MSHRLDHWRVHLLVGMRAQCFWDARGFLLRAHPLRACFWIACIRVMRACWGHAHSWERDALNWRVRVFRCALHGAQKYVPLRAPLVVLLDCACLGGARLRSSFSELFYFLVSTGSWHSTFITIGLLYFTFLILAFLCIFVKFSLKTILIGAYICVYLYVW